MAAKHADHALDEWTECRTSMGRFDSILADTRKYGFTIVTILLTANALVTTSNPVLDREAASLVVSVLVLVLFLMDRYWWVLLNGAAYRANQLERRLGFKITEGLTEAAYITHNQLAATLVYCIFVLVALFVALVAVWPAGANLGMVILIAVTGLVLAAIVWLHVWFRTEFEKTKTRLRAAD